MNQNYKILIRKHRSKSWVRQRFRYDDKSTTDRKREKSDFITIKVCVLQMMFSKKVNKKAHRLGENIFKSYISLEMCIQNIKRTHTTQ
jgi:hypothetical protein